MRCAVDIQAGTFLSAYTGIVAVSSEVPEGSKYVMCLDHFLRASDVIRQDPHSVQKVWFPHITELQCTAVPLGSGSQCWGV